MNNSNYDNAVRKYEKYKNDNNITGYLAGLTQKEMEDWLKQQPREGLECDCLSCQEYKEKKKIICRCGHDETLHESSKCHCGDIHRTCIMCDDETIGNCDIYKPE